MIRRLIHLILPLSVLAGLGFVLWLGVHKQQEKAAANATAEGAAAVAQDPPAEFTVRLGKTMADALAIETKPPRKITLQATRMAFGRVIDPSPLITLDGELSAAAAALSASQAENERTNALAATHDASKKSAEASEAQFLADKIKVDGITRSAQLQWGAVFTRDATKRRTFIDGLVSGSESLIRVDVMPGAALTEMPTSARILILGRESQPLATSDILPATAADPKTQAQGFILHVANPPFALRPGMALSAWLELPQKPRPGFAIPRSAVLRHDGRTWIYVQETQEKLVRKPITLDSPLDAEQGWFVTADGGVSADDAIVVVGAASLLSEELKAQGGGEPD